MKGQPEEVYQENSPSALFSNSLTELPNSWMPCGLLYLWVSFVLHACLFTVRIQMDSQLSSYSKNLWAEVKISSANWLDIS